MSKKAVFLLIVGCLLVCCWPGGMLTDAETIHVDQENGPYFHIQDAIDAAADGDTVFVHSGIYTENIVINKDITLEGESWSDTVIDGGHTGNVVIITRDDVSITECTVSQSGTENTGILLDSVKRISISNCRVEHNNEGIKLLVGSNNNEITETYISNSTGIGVNVQPNSYHNTFFHNNFQNNGDNAYDRGFDNQWFNQTLNEGNYWDDYTGQDDNNDGVGDTRYSIPPTGTANFDEYPLMQEYAGINILHLQAEPQIQEPDDRVNITCGITSSAQVNQSYVNITLPNGTHLNTSLNRHGNTTRYYFNQSYEMKGTYHYTVWANDTENNTIQSAEKTFVIAYKPTARMSYSPSNPRDIDDISFNAENSSDSDGTIETYTWNFGDGTTADGISSIHRYDDDGTYTVTLTVTDNHGAWDVTAEEIHVSNVPPVADFTMPTEGIVGTEISFIDESSDAEDELVEWHWGFGDGTTVEGGPAAANPSHVYRQDGVFNVTLTVTDYDYATDSTTKQITIDDITAPSITHISAYPNPQEIRGRVNVTCQVTDDVAVDDVWVNITGNDPANADITKNVSMHRSADTTTWWYEAFYNTTGNYSVTIWATDPSGNGNTSASHTFEIFRPAMPPEIHSVNATPSDPQYDFPVNISCNVSDNVALASVAVNLTYPDGSSINASMNASCVDEDCNGIYFYNETYTMLGNYSYIIWAIDVNGYVANSPGPNFTVVDTMPPQLHNLSIVPAVQQPNGTVNISCVATDNLAVKNLSIQVKNQSGIVASAQASGSHCHLNRSYPERGHYSVIVHANDTLGNNATFTSQFFITPFPTANFSYTPAMPTSQDIINFTDQSSDDGSITAWQWDFGDGNTSTEQHPHHSYVDNGAFTVTLTVTDNYDATGTTMKEIAVQNVPPTATFTYTPAHPADVEAVVFNASGSTDPDGDIVTYAWDFGDNVTGNGTMPSHTYADNGTYVVTLTVTDDDGASHQVQQNITVDNVPPIADFGDAQNGMQIGVSPNASDPDGTIVNWTWSFGDGTVKYENTSKDMTHQYDHDGGYTVTLTVTDDDNATASTSTHISVGIYISANFTYRANPVSGEPIAFYDNSSHAAAWHWTFGDGTTSNQTNPSHTYSIGNYYTVTLTVTNGSDNASVNKTVPVDTTVHIVKNANNVVNYVPWLGDDIAASALAAQIGSDIMPQGSVVSRWNTTSGAFDSYVVGVSPSSYDFVIHPYDAIVLRVATSGTVTQQAYQLADRLVGLSRNSDNVANHVVWSSVELIAASALAAQIGSDIMPQGSVVSRWNTTSGAFDSYVVGVSPSSYDFVVHPGDCVVLRIAQSGQYHIEVKP